MLRPGLDPDIARPIGALARLAGISAATASGHLRRLVDERLVTVERAGASHQVRLAGPAVAQLRGHRCRWRNRTRSAAATPSWAAPAPSDIHSAPRSPIRPITAA